MNPFATILLCSLDSLFLGVGLGALSPSRRLWLAGALGLADGLAGLFGASSGVTAPAWTAACGPTTLAVYAGGVLLLAATRMRALATHRLGIVVLPLALSLDNLVGAAACGPPSVSAPTGAAMMALASFLLAYAGCALGAALGGRWPGFARPLAAGATLAAAAAMSSRLILSRLKGALHAARHPDESI